MRIVNTTPHEINILTDVGMARLPPCPRPARCYVTRTICGHAQVADCQVPIYDTSYGQVENLPDYEPGTYYVVTNIVAQGARRENRNDVIVPDPLVRDPTGKVIGCYGFTIPDF